MEGKKYQYTCLTNGITSAPRIFTKLMKPVYSTLRQYGHTHVAYIDDSLLIADTPLECTNNVKDTFCLLQNLGSFIHEKKICIYPNTVDNISWKYDSFCKYDSHTSK